VGCLFIESVYFDCWFLCCGGYVDVYCVFVGEGLGLYMWWLWCGKVFDFDLGWRIDYYLVLWEMVVKVVNVMVGCVDSYVE